MAATRRRRNGSRSSIRLTRRSRRAIFPSRLAVDGSLPASPQQPSARSPMASSTTSTTERLEQPDITLSVRQTFGIDCDMQVPAFSRPSDHVPDFDDPYRFAHDTTLPLLAGF